MSRVLLKKSSVAGKVPVTSLSDPANGLEYGELALNYADGKLYFKNSSNVITSFSSGNDLSAVLDRRLYTVTTAGSNTLSVNYAVGFIDVFVNGVKLNNTEFTATSGATVVIPDLSVNDEVQLVGYLKFSLAGLTINGSGLAFDVNSGVLTVNSATTATANTLALRDASGNLTATNLSGTNTGDNAVNSLYSGLVTNATHTGDVTGNTELTLATVNANIGEFGSATNIPVVTVNAKGLVTAVSTVAVSIPSGAITITGDVSGSGTTGSSTTLTLATVNSNIGTWNNVTVNAKGLVTAGSNVAYLTSVIPSNFASQTANTVLAAPNGSAGTPTFRAIAVADIPTLNQNTTGSAATLTTGRTIALTGDVTYTSGSFNGSANVTGAATLASVGTAGTYTKVTTDAKGRVTSGTTLSASDIPSLDASKITSGTIDAARLPSYVDDVIEGTNLAAFPATGETGKIYIALDTNKTYRWSGSAYVYITSGAVDSVGGYTGVVTAANLLAALVTVDGAGSGLDADLLDGNNADAFYLSTNPSGYTTNTGTVTSVSGTGTVAGLSLSGTVTSSGNLTLSGTLSTPISTISDSTTVGQNIVKLANPTAITFLRVNADNTISTLSAAAFRTAIGAGTSSTTGTVTSVAALTIATAGTDVTSTVANGTTTPVITLNIPTASATNRGALSAADWTTFNSKQPAITLTDTVASWAVTGTFAGVLNPTDVFFKPDGTKMFLSTGTTLNQYTLSTPWDITTAGTVTSFTNTWDTVTNGMFISPDGTKLVTCGQTAIVNAGLGIVASEDRAYYLTLSTAWDITTATLVSSLKFGAGIAGLPVAETGPHGITFNSDGTIMYMIGTTVDAIYQYTLTTAYDVSTATYSKQISIALVETAGSGIRFNIAGTRMYIIGTTYDNIVEYRLSTAWDIATAVYYDDLYIVSSESTSQGLYLDETSGNAYIVGTTSDLVTRFNTNSVGILLAPVLATGRIDLVGETRIKNASLLVNGNIYSDGSGVFSGNVAANQISTSSSSITLGASVTTGNATLATAQSTGLITIGGIAGTGAITLGQSTAAQTLNLGTGATAAAITKIVNIGTSGVSTSVTNINIGSDIAGALNTVALNGTIKLPAVGTSGFVKLGAGGQLSADTTTYATGTGTASGTNTGDNAVNTLYSGLVSNATHTGDVTGSTVLTLATVNSNVGTWNNVTVNGKGLVTAGSNTAYLTAESDTLATVTARGSSTSTASTFSGGITHSGLTMTAGTNVDQIYTASDVLTLTTSWQDTSVNAAELATGSYMVQVYADDSTVGGGQYMTYYTGIMSWYSGDTNEASSDEIVLHRAGHASTTGNIFLRVLRTFTADLNNMKLQIAGITANTGTSTYTYKFRRLI